jgi:hypothetical protein
MDVVATAISNSSSDMIGEAQVDRGARPELLQIIFFSKNEIQLVKSVLVLSTGAKIH